MARKATSSRTAQSKRASHTPSDIFQQMEELQRELLVLARRAEDELEALLLTEPQPVIRMLTEFASVVSASDGLLSFDPSLKKFVPLDGFRHLELAESDRLQCALALSGREMTMDFAQSRVYFPVVVFENPIAVAVFKIPNLSSKSYENVCSAARKGICSLRQELKIPRSPLADVNTAS